jgi:hypothetical protein
MDQIMISVLNSNREKKESWLLSLFPKCPNTENNPENCQMFHIRKSMTLTQYKHFLQSKSDSEIDELLIKHFCCINNKF